MGSLGVLSGWQFLLLPICGVVTSIPLVFFAWGIKDTSLSLTGILMYINPTLQLLVGVLVYHETFTATSAVTFGFVWVALILFVGNNLWTLRRQKRESE